MAGQVRSWRVADLGNVSNIADWVDRNVGDRNGYLDEHEVIRYVDGYGADPSHHAAIQALALALGYITVQAGGRISIPRGNNTGATFSINVGGQNATLGPITIRIGGSAPVTLAPPAPDSREIARRLVRAVGSAGESDVDQAVAELALVPAPLLEAIERGGTRVFVCRDNVTDFRADLKGIHAKGSPPWVTNDAADGFFDRRTGIVVATTIDDYGRRVLRSGALLKEIGRALDDLGGGVSKNRAFRRGYESDLPSLKRDDQAFLVQSGDVGAEEAFAQSFLWFTAHRRYLESSYVGLSNFWEGEESSDWRRFV